MIFSAVDELRLAEAVRHTAHVLRSLGARKLTREKHRQTLRKIELAHGLLEAALISPVKKKA